MEAIELQHVGSAEWDAVLDGEQQAWGPDGEDFSWADKQRHVGVLDDEGRPLALAGVLVADVAVGDGEAFPAVGIGGVIVTRAMRGNGLATLLLEAAMRLAGELGPDRAMLFCGDPLTRFYARFGFALIDARVSAEQPAGPVVMPMRAMWAPLTDGASWPAGDVEVLGEPF
jgi:predicted GNAT family N-acyltransferase